jgi:hypothetical protein
MARQILNWQTIIESIATIEAQGETIPLNKQTRRYIRLQRFVREFGHGQSRDGTLRIARDFGLTWRQARKLYIELGRLAAAHGRNTDWESVPAKNAVKKELERVQESIRRIASFQAASSQRNRAALHCMASAADRWAQGQDLDTLRQHGFEPMQFRDPLTGVSGIDFGSTVVISGWFELAPLVHQFAETAIKKLGATQHKLFDWPSSDGRLSAIVQLVGGALPHLYERVTDKRYAISKPRTLTDSNHDVVEQIRAADVGGVRFVGMALEALGLDRLSPDTIASYRQRYQRQAQ